MRKKVFVLALVLVFVAACTHRVDIAMRPNFKAQLQKGHELPNVTPAILFCKGEFSDKRTDLTKLATFKQAVHTYDLYEERPVADALFEGLDAAITASGHKWSDVPYGEVKVNVSFLSLQAARNAGFVMVGATSAIQVKIDFVDAKKGDMIYTNVFSGNDERSQAMIGLIGMVKDSIDASIIRCIQSVVDDAELAKALKKFKG
ncbi:MAG: hypothetical protein Q8O91_05920 [Candidatus Aminicenantes bacterium]|nr:hypothetical protein [Candidatus Aminicenantes bacterium]